MSKEGFLLLFSWAFIVAMLALILVPYVRGRRDLFVALNLFLFGSAIFVGLSGINSYYIGQFFDYSALTYLRFYAAIVVFYVTLLITYKSVLSPVRAAEKHSVSLPVVSNKGLMVLLFLTLCMFLGQIASVAVPGLGRLVNQVGMIAPGFAVVFAFFAWDRAKGNPFMWMLLAVTLVLALVTLFAMGGGRRSLYGAALALPLCFYWRFLRNWRPMKVVLLFVLLAVPGVIFDIAYEAVRWKGTSRSVVEVDGAGGRLGLLLESIETISSISMGRIAHMAQTGVEYSLVSIHLHTEDHYSLPVQPLHSVYTLLTAPIPRAIWPGKPLHLGMTLGFDSGLIKAGTRTNVGPGIAGHCYHEGGLIMALFYGFFVGWVLRYLDVLLIRRLNDPVLIGFLAASAFHLMGWSRGAIFTFTLWPLICFAVALGFYFFCKTFKLAYRIQPMRPHRRTVGRDDVPARGRRGRPVPMNHSEGVNASVRNAKEEI